MDGFITNGTYPVALNRLDDAMVALLAIEHFTSPNAITAVPSITSPIVTPTQFSTAGNENNPANPPLPGAPAPAPGAPAPAPGAPAPAPGAPAPAPVNPAPTPKQTRRAVDGRTLSQAKNDGIVLVSTTDRSAGVLLAKAGDGAAAPAATASTSGSAPPPETVVDQIASSGTGTGGTGTTGGAPPPATKVTSDTGVGVNAATANAVESITSIYQFKNLDETCLALAGQTLQVEFQLFTKANSDGDLKSFEGVAHDLEDESKVHVWRYFNQIFDEFFLARTHMLQAPVSATGSLINPPTGLTLTPNVKPSRMLKSTT